MADDSADKGRVIWDSGGTRHARSLLALRVSRGEARMQSWDRHLRCYLETCMEAGGDTLDQGMRHTAPPSSGT